MTKVYMVIVNCGDGSNSIDWVIDKAVIDRMQELADNGEETYASGDGLQVKTLNFPDSFDVQAWLKTNYLSLTTMKDMENYD